METMNTTEVVILKGPEAVLAGDPAEKFPVDGRRLHAWLEIQTDYFRWMSRRIEEYGFQPEVDFSTFKSRSVEYSLSLGMAKELAMVERSAKGREIRKYFIACEEKLKQVVVSKKQWHLAREEGKLSRRVETDIIKSFVEYARRQGSENADMYFMNFSKMVNAALLDLDGGKAPPNLRDSLNHVQLHALSVAETIIARILVQTMTEQRPYKDIYRAAKEQIAQFAAAVGKTRPGISAREAVGLVA